MAQRGMKITIDDRQLRRLVKRFPHQIRRAGEITLDKIAYDGRDEVKSVMGRVFDRPTRFTLNSLKVERTRHHNMISAVGFKEPDRMGRHYLFPQVEGGARKLKGFERGLGHAPYMPSKHAKLDRYGNLPYGVIVQLLSVLGKAEHVAGFTSNISATSKRRNRKPRDYVLLQKKHGKLPPGVYQRVQSGVGFGAKTKKTLPFGEYQKGQRRGRFASVIKARGLRPVLIKSKSSSVRYSKRLRFYEIVHKVVNDGFAPKFLAQVVRQVARRSR